MNIKHNVALAKGILMEITSPKKLVLYGALVLSAITANVSAAEQPNIIYILADDMGQGDTTCLLYTSPSPRD